ncbi:MAG: AmmeMemoRadiSam system radical SAM enzyme [Candidatus Omnitrophica bacterium]|nr:AmmeMemoRadiSam system radical SAM enzyme [Candidatus Omnitrophota bacterium]
MKEALLYVKLENNFVACNLCAHRCRIAEGKFGFCGVRQNLKGALYTHAYGRVAAAHVDPVEKKPLYHFLPGTYSFSVATIGCNFHCGFCQNWEISQADFRNAAAEGRAVSAQELVDAALQNKCRSISYTYTEPTIFFEYALETAKLAKAKGLRNIFVTNGYMTREALELIRPDLDAANVDLKFFNESSYKRVCSASLAPVLETIKLMYELGIWVEVTTLVIPGENDSDEELKGIAGFIASVNKNIPWHVSRFHPDYKFNTLGPTDEGTLKMAEDIGRLAGLNFVYAGNVQLWGNDTHCPHCKKLLVKREVFNILENDIKQGMCAYCSAVIPGVFA